MFRSWTTEEILLLDQAVKAHLTTEDIETLGKLLDRSYQATRKKILEIKPFIRAVVDRSHQCKIFILIRGIQLIILKIQIKNILMAMLAAENNSLKYACLRRRKIKGRREAKVKGKN